MSYRPSISEETNRIVDTYMIGKSGKKNEKFEAGIHLMLNEEGEKHEWFSRLEMYCIMNNIYDIDDDSLDKVEQNVELLDKIIREVIDSDGDPNIQFKEKLDLD